MNIHNTITKSTVVALLVAVHASSIGTEPASTYSLKNLASYLPKYSQKNLVTGLLALTGASIVYLFWRSKKQQKIQARNLQQLMILINTLQAQLNATDLAITEIKQALENGCCADQTQAVTIEQLSNAVDELKAQVTEQGLLQTALTEANDTNTEQIAEQIAKLWSAAEYLEEELAQLQDMLRTMIKGYKIQVHCQEVQDVEVTLNLETTPLDTATE
jgi:DNA repair exonuclease SbcCD ATPase subunit